MSASRNARPLARAALGLSLLAASPLAAQPLEPAASPVVPAPGSAAPAPKLSPRQQIAKELFERGREKWSLGEYREAAALLTASNEQAERPATLLLLGESLEKLGHYRSAHHHFERAVEVARRMQDLPMEARASTRAAAILPLIPRMELRFSLPPPGSTLITLNGVELPRAWLNRAMPFDAGEYRLDVRAPGHAPYSAQVLLSNDAARLGVQVVLVTLTPLPAPPELPPAPAAPLVPEDTGTPSERQLAWIAGGVGAAAAVSGVVLTLIALDKKNGAARECEDNASGSDPCSGRGMDLRQQSRTLANLATVSAIASGAAFGTSLTLFVLAEQAATPAGAGVRYSASF